MSPVQLLAPSELSESDAPPVDLVPNETAWTELAACKGRTPLFFPPKAERPQARERREAKARRLCSVSRSGVCIMGR